MERVYSYNPGARTGEIGAKEREEGKESVPHFFFYNLTTDDKSNTVKHID